MLEPILLILAGFVALIWSADIFIAGAASIAFNRGMSKLMIGLTIVAFGTSAPEILVSLFASLEGSGEMAVGNALGSNLANVGLVLGITALVAAIPIGRRIIINEVPILLGVMLLAGITLFDLYINIVDSIILLTGLAVFMIYLFRQKSDSNEEDDLDEEVNNLTELSEKRAYVYFIVGLVVLLFSADLLVDGAKTLAEHFGVPELIIGLTVVAIGTSLPELAASIASALRGHHEIAFGNVIGSNIFNLLVVMAVPGLVSGNNIEANAFFRDYTAMILISTLWFMMLSYSISKQKSFGRLFGGMLLTSYCLYYVILYQQL